MGGKTAALCTLTLALSACGGDAAPGVDAEAPSGVDADVGVETDPADVADGSPPADTAAAAPYTVTAFDDVRIHSVGDVDVRTVLANVDLGPGPFRRATMRVALDTTCYPFARWADDPPPAGHNWPPSCDAFDRNFEITLDPPAGDGNPPGVELVRAITPFGGPMAFDVDVTDVLNGMPGARTVRTHITTFSDGAGLVSGSAGGWNVSVSFELVPGPAPRRILAVIPLYDGSLGPGDGVDATFEVPEGARYTLTQYRATGHGGGESFGCIGPAEEFCERRHVITIDGEALLQPRLWRRSCEDLCTIVHDETFGIDHCAENPCGAVASVRAPRANWCPGDITPPEVWDFEAWRVPGPHRFQSTVQPLIAPGGSWRTSVVVIAYGD